MDNVITALTSDGMVAPSYWIDPKSGNNYMVTVQYANRWINNMSMEDFEEHSPARRSSGRLQPDAGGRAVRSGFAQMLERRSHRGLHAAELGRRHPADQHATEVDHYQIRRVIDIYVATKTEALQSVGAQHRPPARRHQDDRNTCSTVRGAVVSMNQSFKEFGVGLIIAVLLVYLILMAQFASFIDPFIILMAIPPGLAGVVLILLLTGSTLNIMSLMGVIMMTGIVVSNSILIVEFAGILHEQGMPLLEAVVEACKVRLRPILMTSLATLLGMIPMALGTGSRQRAICAAGARGHRRTGGFGGRHGVPGSRRVPGDPRPGRRKTAVAEE